MLAVQARESRLAHALAVLYATAIAYASLQPFGDWMAPLPDTPFWLLGQWPARPARFDLVANVLTYIPLGLFIALIPRGMTTLGRVLLATLVGAVASFAMETLQWYMPPRHAAAVDFVANTLGAFAGGLLGAAYARSFARALVREARRRFILPGTMGDVGMALLAAWLVAQLNPAIAPFSLTFDPEPLAAQAAAVRSPETAVMLIEAAQSAFQLLGVGLFATLLVRDREDAGGAVLMLVGTALLLKGAAAMILLKPAVFESWLSPGALLGVAAGALAMLPAIMLPRPVQVTLCAIALLSSLLTPLLAPDLMFAAPPLTLFNARYGHLLNFNGLTRIVLVGWPLAASIWLFALAGRPGWGHADAMPAPHREPPDPL
jgi:VanZ family protein